MESAPALALATAQGGKENEFGRKNGGGKGEGNVQGSQGVQGKGQDQGGQGQGQGQGQGHWNQGYRRGAVATTDAFLEARLLVERLSCGKSLVSGWVQRVLTISYARLGQGGGTLYCWKRRRRKGNLAQIMRK